MSDLALASAISWGRKHRWEHVARDRALPLKKSKDIINVRLDRRKFCDGSAVLGDHNGHPLRFDFRP